MKFAAIREAKEEAGVDIDPNDLNVIGVIHRKNSDSEWIDFYLIVHKWRGCITNVEPNKCEELRWFKLTELLDNMIVYVREAVEKEHREMWL